MTSSAPRLIDHPKIGQRLIITCQRQQSRKAAGCGLLKVYPYRGKITTKYSSTQVDLRSYRNRWRNGASYHSHEGHNHPDTLTNAYNLGIVLSKQGKHDQTEPMYRRVIEERENVLGPKDSVTLNIVDSLGSALESQGQYGEAETMYRRAADGLEKGLGCGHSETLTSVRNLLLVLRKQGEKNVEARSAG
ncbi:hypothetical protein VTN49DRAFT_2091 [Thermomyces lanuginosus]|uniref:uncharacterized protein n=1 Tax=Thermomyces lanuginosus TaxID=5541 RepID=UPI003744A7B4